MVELQNVVFFKVTFNCNFVGENDEEYHTDQLPSLMKPSVGKCTNFTRARFILSCLYILIAAYCV